MARRTTKEPDTRVPSNFMDKFSTAVAPSPLLVDTSLVPFPLPGMQMIRFVDSWFGLSRSAELARHIYAALPEIRVEARPQGQWSVASGVYSSGGRRYSWVNPENRKSCIVHIQDAHYSYNFGTPTAPSHVSVPVREAMESPAVVAVMCEIERWVEAAQARADRVSDAVAFVRTVSKACGSTASLMRALPGLRTFCTMPQVLGTDAVDKATMPMRGKDWVNTLVLDRELYLWRTAWADHRSELVEIAQLRVAASREEVMKSFFGRISFAIVGERT